MSDYVRMATAVSLGRLCRKPTIASRAQRIGSRGGGRSLARERVLVYEAQAFILVLVPGRSGWGTERMATRSARLTGAKLCDRDYEMDEETRSRNCLGYSQASSYRRTMLWLLGRRTQTPRSSTRRLHHQLITCRFHIWVHNLNFLPFFWASSEFLSVFDVFQRGE